MADRYRWARIGDINAFFGLMLDNVAGLILMVSLLSENFQFPVRFALRYMVPGTALGVLIGDLLFFLLAIYLARTSSNKHVTAMPLGLDTPSTIGMVFFVLGPAYSSAVKQGMAENDAAFYAWQIGICSVFISGIFKFLCAFGSGWVRRSLPRAGLLGSLAAIALVLISFLPLLEVLHYPLVGLIALAIVLTALVGRVPLPFRLPGALGGLVVAGAIFGIMSLSGLIEPPKQHINPSEGLWPTEWMQALSFDWLSRMTDTINYLPIVIPFALATVVGGIDCTESAAAAGDHYHTGTVIGIEAFATLAASFCGAVIQTTPYIGHPAYKAMGGSAAYTLATAIMMGVLGLTGLFGYFYQFIPVAAVYPILVFVGLEITAQSFLATPRRHYPAVALACVPALATLATYFVGQLWGDPALLAHGIHPGTLQKAELASKLATVNMLSNGFLLTSVFWSSALAMAIDRRLAVAAGFYFLAAVCTLFGIIHSPMPGAPILLPIALPGLDPSTALPSAELHKVLHWAAGYLLAALAMVVWDRYLHASGQMQSDFSHDD